MSVISQARTSIPTTNPRPICVARRAPGALSTFATTWGMVSTRCWLFATFAAVIKLLRGRIDNLLERLFGLLLFVASTSASVHLIPSVGLPALPVGHGGVVGYALGEYLEQNLRGLGTLIILGSCLLVGLVFVTDGWVLKLPSTLKRVKEASGGAVAAARCFARSASRPMTAAAAAGGAVAARAVLDVGESETKVKGERAGRSAGGDSEDQKLLFDQESEEEVEEFEDGEFEDEELTGGVEPEHEAGATEEENAGRRRRKGRRKPTGPIVNFPSPKRHSVEAYPREIENWTLPSIDLLHEPEYGFTSQQEQFVRDQAKTLERTLEEFRLDARVVEIDTGPVITMFELKLGAGVKVSQVASLSNDIARAMKAHAIRVVAPIPGKNTVGIEVPNLRKETVRMRELMTLAGRKASGMRLPLFLGKDAAGKPLLADLGQDAASSDCRHDRIRKERVHQLDHRQYSDDQAA